MKKIKIAYIIFFLYKFGKSFVFLAHAAKTDSDAGKLYKLGKPSFCQTPILAKSKKIGVDFVFPLSQESHSQESQPHQNLVVPGKLEE
jgi:hypothetical protein